MLVWGKKRQQGNAMNETRIGVTIYRNLIGYRKEYGIQNREIDSSSVEGNGCGKFI